MEEPSRTKYCQTALIFQIQFITKNGAIETIYESGTVHISSGRLISISLFFSMTFADLIHFVKSLMP